MTEPKQPLDILYVGMLPPHPGGAPQSSAGLLSGFGKRGHRVRALAPILAAALAEDDVFAECHPEIEITRFAVPYMQIGPDVPPSEDYRRIEGDAIAAALPALIAARQPDIVMLGRESYAWHPPGTIERYDLPSVLRIAGGTTVGITRGKYPPVLAEAYLSRMRRATRRVGPARHLADILRRYGVGDVDVILKPSTCSNSRPGRRIGTCSVGWR